MDSSIFEFFHSLTGKSGFLDGAVIFFATYLPYLLVVAVLFFLWRRGDNRQRIYAFIFTALTLILSRGLITEIVRFFYQRPRPFEFLGFQPLLVPDSHSSLPSGHAVFFFALALVVFYFNKKWGWWFLGLALIISLARVCAGVHWPSDILGGIVVAFISFLIVRKLLRPFPLIKER